MKNSPVTLTQIIDGACGPLAQRLEQRRLPTAMRVHPDVFDCIRVVRAQEIADGYPLMFLGMELQSDAALAPDGFAFDD